MSDAEILTEGLSPVHPNQADKTSSGGSDTPVEQVEVIAEQVHLPQDGLENKSKEALESKGVEDQPEVDHAQEPKDQELQDQELTDIVVTAQVIEPPSLSLSSAESDDMAQATRLELLEQNKELLGWINELQISLAECQVDFKSHLRQFEQQEHLLENRTQDLIASQEQVVALNRELELVKNENQRKKILVETLKAQLGSSQERIAQMERECTLSQRRCAEQSQQLLQAEGLCRDLKSRLNRQQRNTLQFKSALEKSLEMSVSPANFELPDLEVEPIEGPEDFFPRSKPVKPWSQQTGDESFGEVMTSGPFSSPETATPEDGSRPVEPVETLEPVFDPAQAETLTATLQSDSQLRAMGQEPDLTASQVEVAESSRISFVPPIVPTAPIPSPAGLCAASGESENVVQVAAPVTETPEVRAPEAKPEADAGSSTGASEIPDAEASCKVPQPDDGELVSQPANWPSPLVNPVRPAKKRLGSLAAIDLPSFPKAPA